MYRQFLFKIIRCFQPYGMLHRINWELFFKEIEKIGNDAYRCRFIGGGPPGTVLKLESFLQKQLKVRGKDIVLMMIIPLNFLVHVFKNSTYVVGKFVRKRKYR